MKCKGCVTTEEDCQSQSAASHPVVNKFAKVCNANSSLCHTYMELFVLDGLYAALLYLSEILMRRYAFN
jgi:hypothetical protein